MPNATSAAPSFGASLPPFSFAQLKGGAVWPCWRESVAKIVKFRPMPKKEAYRLYHQAHRIETQTRLPGRQDGAITRNGLRVLHALLFGFLNYTTGRLDPSHIGIAKKAGISERSVRRGLAALKLAGVVNWLRRCAEEWIDGRYTLKQERNAYAVLPATQWRGCAARPEPPPPAPGTWGEHPPLPDALDLAVATKRRGGGLAAVLDELESDPGNELASALARYGRGFLPRLL